MKRSKFPLLVILVIAATVATTSTPAAILREHGPSAFGAGQFRYVNPQTARTEIWSFSFEAISNKNGQTRGRAHFENLTAQKQVVVRINCLSVQSSSVQSGGLILFDTTNVLLRCGSRTVSSPSHSLFTTLQRQSSTNVSRSLRSAPQTVAGAYVKEFEEAHSLDKAGEIVFAAG